MWKEIEGLKDNADPTPDRVKVSVKCSNVKFGIDHDISDTVSNALIHRSKVDFPEPDAPISTVAEWAATSSEIPRKTG